MKKPISDKNSAYFALLLIGFELMHGYMQREAVSKELSEVQREHAVVQQRDRQELVWDARTRANYV